MALGSGNKATWEDIYQLYSDINTERLRFGFTESVIPDKQNIKASVDTISDLKTLIDEMSNNTQVGDAASTSTIEVPTRGSLLTAVPLAGLKNVVAKVESVGTENSAYFGSYNGGDFRSNHSGFFATNFGVCSFRATNFSGNHSGFRATDFSGNHSGFRATNFSGNHSGFRATDFSGNHSGFRATNFSSNHSHRATNFATNHARFGFDRGHSSQGAANGRFNGTHRTNGFR